MSAAASDGDTAALAEALRHAIGDFVRAVRAQSAPTTARSETLGLLDRGGAMSVAGLAQLRHVKHQSMRLVVAQLEAEGLVVRTADAADRRSQRVALTERGRGALTEARAARAASIGRIMRATLSEADRDVLRAAVPVLCRMTGSLSR